MGEAGAFSRLLLSRTTPTIGGHVSRDFTEGYGPKEYVLRRAQPGVYRIRCKYCVSRQQTLVGPATVTATVITSFGRADERRRVLTLRLETVKDMVDIGAVTIGGATQPEQKPVTPVTRAGRSGVTTLVYRTVEGTEVRLGFGPGLLWAREVHQGAERELRLR